MAKHGKKYRKIKETAPQEAMTLDAAIDFLKKNPGAKFDETVELGIRLGVDSAKSENSIRGTVSLPHGSGKNVRILVFASGSAADAARKAGAEFVGMDDMIEKVKGGWTEFDVAIATSEAMGEVRKLGRVLGPRGLMPNPKTGTVTEDTASAVSQSKAGKVEFRMDRNGNVNVPVGKLSFEAKMLVENASAVLEGVKAERPSGIKGVYIKKCTVTSTMGVGIRIIVSETI